jgi:transposase
MIKRTVISLILAKRIIQAAKISSAGELLFNKAMPPDRLREFLANQESSLVVMEGCGSCHYWARFAEACGHQAKIIAPETAKMTMLFRQTLKSVFIAYSPRIDNNLHRWNHFLALT